MTRDGGHDPSRVRDSDSEGGPSLEELLVGIGSGDENAFAGFYDATSRRVFGLVRRLLVDPAQSEEVTQEVYLEVWQTAPRYDPARGGAMAWTMTMAHRRAVDRIRSSQSSRDRDERVGVRDWSPDFDAVAETVETRLESERVKLALGRLTEFQREAVTLAYFGGYSNTEVAGLLRIPIGTVKTRLRDGMIRLRDELGVTS